MYMKYKVEFVGLDLDISISPKAKFRHGYFIFGHGGGLVNRDNGQVYPSVKGLVIENEIDEPTEGRKLFDVLDNALYLAEEILTGIVATTQTNFVFKKPITCIYEGKHYDLADSMWHEVILPDQLISGGESFVEDVSYLDIEKNFHPKYHFYRVAKDEANPIDYRILNVWRFLEAHFGKQGEKLNPLLKTAPAFKEIDVDVVYEQFRCAVAHAAELNQDVESKRVILPRHLETNADGSMHLLISDLVASVDKIVKHEKPVPAQSVR